MKSAEEWGDMMAKDTKITVKDYSKSMLQQMDKAESQALENMGKYWLDTVRKIVMQKGIYDTGELHDSLKYKVDQQNKSIQMISEAPHSEYNELGTYKMAARPFMQPSIEQSNGAFAQTTKQTVEGALSNTSTIRPEVREYYV